MQGAREHSKVNTGFTQGGSPVQVYPLREAHFTATSIWKWAWVSSKGPVFP